MALRWARVLGLDAPVQAGTTWRLPLQGGWVDFVSAGARGEGIDGYTLAVADRSAVVQQARVRGAAVDGDAIVLFGTRVSLLDLS
jgi:hypothetical protein